MQKQQDVPKQLLKPQKQQKKQKIPRQIRQILAQNETIERRLDLVGCKVYATNQRLLKLEGRTVRDFEYNHISSVEYSSKRHWWLIVIGIMTAIIGFFAGDMILGLQGAITGVIIGIIPVILGIMSKSEWIETNIVGVHDSPIIYKGNGQHLDILFQIIRQKRLTENEPDHLETKQADFTDTIRKLAELRDDGIITTEEFEEKKKKLLSSD